MMGRRSSRLPHLGPDGVQRVYTEGRDYLRMFFPTEENATVTRCASTCA